MTMGRTVTVAGRPLDLGDPAGFAQPREIDVLVPTRNRPAELATVLAGLAAQDIEVPFGVVISDQSDGEPGFTGCAAAAMVRVLRHGDHPVLLEHHLPRHGLAEQRAFLLSRSRARRVLFLDDDVWLEPAALRTMRDALRELRCGFVGNFPHGLSYADDHRPDQQRFYEPWDGPPVPEEIGPENPRWQRAALHGAANLLHVTEDLGLRPGQWRAYKVAWLGACVLYDRDKLVAAGGYEFWRRVPAEHSGEDVLAQMRVMRHYGGAGIVPSRAYHLEAPTTVADRPVECFEVLR